ncbi:hypothetical protein U9M48_026311 [Paspalum notatum var. saurae]|uniref:SWIM-type domain-containing protein n=1 Tax=Paspalum notatum var. saurae TaxID=547442 RepID=A0AAQ3TRZ4_PASNO
MPGRLTDQRVGLARAPPVHTLGVSSTRTRTALFIGAAAYYFGAISCFFWREGEPATTSYEKEVHAYVIDLPRIRKIGGCPECLVLDLARVIGSLLSSLTPRDGMEFSIFYEPWMFWVSYGGLKGFEVRRRFVCANEGHRLQDKKDYLTKCPRAETRTDYQVRMGVSLDKKKGKYTVSDLILEHNHILHLPETSHLMVSQRKISEVQGFEIETADDVGIRPKAAHGLASLQNAVKHLSKPENEESSSSPKHLSEGSEKEPSILADFSACMYEYEDEATFEHAFNIMRTKACKKSWLDSIYKLKEKWAECYMKDVYTLGMRSTQLSASLNAELKRHFKSDFDIIRFLKHFERVVQDKRNNELNAEFESRKKLPRIKMWTPMLIQASKLYTPVIFEAFQGEYERSMAACTTTLEGNNEFLVAIGCLDENFTLEKEYKVTGDALEQTSICSCGQFKRVGILCGHALKVLDLMNIKALPTHYVEKRWIREARSGTVQDKQDQDIIENPRFDNMFRYKNMTRKFLNVADRAASYPSCTLLVNSTIDILSKQIEEQINGFSSTMNSVTVSLNVTPSSEVSIAQLKKKKVETKTSKRKRSWVEKMHKGSKKGHKKNDKQSVEPNPTNVALHNGAAVQNISPSASSPTEGMSEPYIAINTFSGLLTKASQNVNVTIFQKAVCDSLTWKPGARAVALHRGDVVAFNAGAKDGEEDTGARRTQERGAARRTLGCKAADSPRCAAGGGVVAVEDAGARDGEEDAVMRIGEDDAGARSVEEDAVAQGSRRHPVRRRRRRRRRQSVQTTMYT